MNLLKEKINIKLSHIILIILGIVFVILPNLHAGIWFDESYSVALVNNSFFEIWQIGSNDVHPVLYYMLLKIVNIIFGPNILVYRLFSVLGIIILGIIGYTHIRKDYGEKEGIIFTFLSFFLPAILVYSGEIRMYTYSIVFVLLTYIYLTRYLKQSNKKDLIKFGICSICSCYLHYYALIAMGIINLYLLIYTIKTKKNVKLFSIITTSQILLYLPWLFIFIKQALSVGGGFWISIEYPEILYKILLFPFDLGNVFLIFVIPLYIYLGYLMKKNYKAEVVSAVYIVGLVILIAMIASIISPILITRYLFTILGLLIFTISIYLAESNKYILGVTCALILAISINNNINQIQDNYSKESSDIEAYIETINEEDYIIYSNNNINGLCLTFNKSQNQYFVDYLNWGIEEAYKAYNMDFVKTIEELDLPDKYYLVLQKNQIPNELKVENYEITNINEMYTKYHNISYCILELTKIKMELE